MLTLLATPLVISTAKWAGALVIGFLIKSLFDFLLPQITTFYYQLFISSDEGVRKYINSLLKHPQISDFLLHAFISAEKAFASYIGDDRGKQKAEFAATLVANKFKSKLGHDIAYKLVLTGYEQMKKALEDINAKNQKLSTS